jgi:hypothetical protein
MAQKTEMINSRRFESWLCMRVYGTLSVKSRWPSLSLFLAALPSARIDAALPVPGPGQADPDSDGDSLSDYREIHKYHTDPDKPGTAGKGVQDGDWRQRREFTYSVRAVMRVMPPYNLRALNDGYQDVCVLAEKKEYADLEVVVYPFSSNAESIAGKPNWKQDGAGMKEYLAPGISHRLNLREMMFLETIISQQ